MNNITIINDLSLLSPFDTSEVENLTRKLKESCGIKNSDVDQLVIRNKIQGFNLFPDAQADIEFYQNGN